MKIYGWEQICSVWYIPELLYFAVQTLNNNFNTCFLWSLTLATTVYFGVGFTSDRQASVRIVTAVHTDVRAREMTR